MFNEFEARKDYTCYRCKRPIARGEQYFRHAQRAYCINCKAIILQVDRALFLQKQEEEKRRRERLELVGKVVSIIGFTVMFFIVFFIVFPLTMGVLGFIPGIILGIILIIAILFRPKR